MAHPYLKMLRDMNRQGIKVADLPDDVARSLLALHQDYLNHFTRRIRRKENKR